MQGAGEGGRVGGWQAASPSQRQRRYYWKLLEVAAAILEGMSKSIDGFILDSLR